MSYPDNQGQSLIPAPVHITPLDSFYISFIISFSIRPYFHPNKCSHITVQKFNIIHHRSRALMTSETFMTINKHRRGFITVHTCHYNEEFHDGQRSSICSSVIDYENVYRDSLSIHKGLLAVLTLREESVWKVLGISHPLSLRWYCVYIIVSMTRSEISLETRENSLHLFYIRDGQANPSSAPSSITTQKATKPDNLSNKTIPSLFQGRARPSLSLLQDFSLTRSLSRIVPSSQQGGDFYSLILYLALLKIKVLFIYFFNKEMTGLNQQRASSQLLYYSTSNESWVIFNKKNL